MRCRLRLAILIPQINMLTNSIFLGRFEYRSIGQCRHNGCFYLIFAVAGHGLNNALQSVFCRYAGSDNTEAFKTILAQGIRICLQLSLHRHFNNLVYCTFYFATGCRPKAYPQEISFLKIRIWGLPFLYFVSDGQCFFGSIA